MEKEYTEEMEKTIMDAYYKHLTEEDSKRQAINNEAVKFVKANIDYDFDLMELDEIHWQHEGYVEVEKFNNKNGFYPNHEFYTEKGGKIKYMKQDEEEGNYHSMCYQETGFLGDDYSGFILYPLKDGKYWKIIFYC